MNNIKENEAVRPSFSFIRFLGEFFTNYKQFIQTHLTAAKPPFLYLTIWLLGMTSAIGRAERQYGLLREFQLDSWIKVWAFILIGGIIFGCLHYWIGGSLYHLRVWLAGGKKNFRISRFLFLYTGLPFYLIALFSELFNTFIYGNAYFTKPTNSLFYMGWGIIWIIAIIYSIILSYRGVRLLLETGFIRTVIFFIVLPAMVFSAPIAWTFYQGLEYKPKWKHFEGGLHLVLEVESEGAPSVDIENTLRTKEILAERMRQVGIRKRIIKITGERRIIVQLPKLKNPARVIGITTKSYVLEFKLVDEEHNLEEALKGNIPAGREILYQISPDPKSGQQRRTPYLLKRQTLLTGEYLTDARVQIDSQYNEPYVALTFNARGGKLLERITGENIDKRLAIVLDNNVYSAPVIRDRILGGRAQITGRFTMDEARDLVIVLRAGAYPAPTRLIESRDLTRDIWLGSES